MSGRVTLTSADAETVREAIATAPVMGLRAAGWAKVHAEPALALLVAPAVEDERAAALEACADAARAWLADKDARGCGSERSVKATRDALARLAAVSKEGS
jgi:hypothetical protein